MDPAEKIERRREARSRIRAQRERAGRLKTRVVAISLICFALLWGVVFVQMATGHDPVLGSTKPTERGGGNSRVARTGPPEEAAELEAEPVEIEPVEVEPVEEEFVEEEPAPVTTGQS